VVAGSDHFYLLIAADGRRWSRPTG